MNTERKEIIASKRQLNFYKKCYSRYGYEVEAEYRNKNHFHYTLLLKNSGTLSVGQKEALRQTEEKLRIIEVIDQKKRRFFTLFFNLIIHASLFCLQGLLLLWLGLYDSHPVIMLKTGVVLLQIILVIGFCFKLWEALKWNVIQKRLKEEVLTEEYKEEKLSVPRKHQRYISVLFTRGTGFFPVLLYWLTGRMYTHASIGLGEQNDCFYSFNFKGFRAEHPAHRRLRKGNKDSLCYQFCVSEVEYLRLQKTIDGYMKEKEEYHYSCLGAVFCILHIYLPLKQKKHYFCSEFVSEQLQNMDSMELKRAPGMYFPNNLAKALVKQKNLHRVLVNEV